MAASRLVRVNDAEYQPSPALVISNLSIGVFAGARGTSFLSSGTASFASGFASVAFGFTPNVVLATANEGNTLATIQNWSSVGFTVTEKNVNGSILGTVGFGFIAVG